MEHDESEVPEPVNEVMFEFTSVGQMSLSKKIPRTIKIVSLKKIQFIFYTN
jgi:hypothetical protein